MNKVAFLRRGYNITQETISNTLNISRVTFRKKERGDVDWTKNEMEKLTALFREYDSSLNMEKIFFDNNFTVRK